MAEQYMQHLMSSIDAETWVLGAILEDYAQVMPKVIEILEKPEDFYTESHQWIYATMLELYENGDPVTLLSVAEALQQSDTLGKVGGVTYLNELQDSCPTIADIGYHALLVKEPAFRRQVAQDAMKLYELAMAPDSTAESLREQLQGLSRMSKAEEVRIYTIAEAWDEYAEFVKNLSHRKLKFGWPEVDAGTRGLIPGDVCIILARASVGKSAVVQSLQLDAWERQGMSSIFFSLEMPVTAVFERAASMRSGWEPDAIEEIFQTGDADRLLEKMDSLLYAGIYICDRAGLRLRDIQRIVEQKKVDLVIIDYMGLLVGEGSTQYERTSSIARGLKELAKETGTIVVCVCQTSRAGGTGEDRVTLSMARDSGVTEEGCDVMIGMHRPPDSDGLILAYVLKARRGRAGAETELQFLGQTPKVVCLAKEWQREGAGYA